VVADADRDRIRALGRRDPLPGRRPASALPGRRPAHRPRHGVLGYDSVKDARCGRGRGRALAALLRGDGRGR
jgi:hypothetical protein